MCGDLEPDEAAALDAYRHLAGRLARARAEASRHQTGGLSGYLAGLFNIVLRRACDDAETIDLPSADMLLGQAVVMARAAGVLARHIDPASDPLRSVIEALMDGYTNPRSP